MAVTTIKKSHTKNTDQSVVDETRRIVQEMLETIKNGGEKSVLDYARELDNWSRQCSLE